MVKELKSSEEFITLLKSGAKFFVDFYADWCGPCRAMAPVVDEVSESLTSLDFYKLNVDDADDVAELLKITNIPCFMLFENGQIVKKFVGMKTKESLESELK